MVVSVYYVVYKMKISDEYKFMKVESEYNEYYTCVYLREKGYRISICECYENFVMYRDMDKQIFLKVYKNYPSGLQNYMREIELNCEIIEIEKVEINERKNKGFRDKYSNYFVRK